MPKRLGISDLRNRIDWAIGRVAAQQRALTIPIDLEAICAALRISVEWRCMVSEGVMAVDTTALRIYLQSNFRDDPRVRRRLRFTWAHEICHALFYEQTGEHIRLLPGAPSGATLERLCQQGAGYLLIPSRAIAKECSKKTPVSSVQSITALAAQYDVSLDVLLRRLNEIDGALDTDYAIFLLRQGELGLRIDSAATGSWLMSHANPPRIGDMFENWAAPMLSRATMVSAGNWTLRIEDRDLEITRSKPSPTFEIVEFRLI